MRPPKFNFRLRSRNKALFKIITAAGEEFDYPHGTFNFQPLPLPGELAEEAGSSWRASPEGSPCLQKNRSVRSLDVSVEYLEALVRETLRFRNVNFPSWNLLDFQELSEEKVQILFMVYEGRDSFSGLKWLMLLKDFGEPLEAINLAGPLWRYFRHDLKPFKFEPAEKRIFTVAQDWRQFNPEEFSRRKLRPLIRTASLKLIK
ncbi:MAG: hypothetical protein LBK52_07180 [Deltaproteobacteria bacterium]|jgi:hypothetical protein|nr:hypothetical protein [Deltaproteobacteria bacterium]